MTKPRKAILFAEARTGGAFLASCLSNHPRVFFARGEPLHKGSPWTVAAPDEIKRLDLITSQDHYDVSGCKLFRNHARRPHIQEWLFRVKPLMIYLWREDYVLQALSIEANKVHRRTGEGLPTHPYERMSPLPIELDPAAVLFEIDRLQQNYGLTGNKEESNWAFLQAGGFEVFSLTYEQMTGGSEVEGITGTLAHEICDFLGVTRANLPGSGLRQAHHRPWPEYVTNWAEVKRALVAHLDPVGFMSTTEEGKGRD